MDKVGRWDFLVGISHLLLLAVRSCGNNLQEYVVVSMTCKLFEREVKK